MNYNNIQYNTRARTRCIDCPKLLSQVNFKVSSREHFPFYIPHALPIIPVIDRFSGLCVLPMSSRLLISVNIM